MEFFTEDPRYALQTFSRQSSDYLRHSVLSPKRFGQKEMKIEQKARPPPKSRILGGGQGGTSTDLREVCARRFIKSPHSEFPTGILLAAGLTAGGDIVWVPAVWP